MTPIINPEVAAVFASYPADVVDRLMSIRQLIFDVASITDGVGELQETLKWGQPSYITAATNSGSPIRIDRIKSQPGRYAVYFHCQTSLVSTFRALYGDAFRYEGDRALVFDRADDIPADKLEHCIALALTYHLNKKRKRLPKYQDR